jgi:cytosine/adenosine deaminase-related metal-dependent hydrolase
MTTPEALLTNCRIADGRLVDIGIADGQIVCVGEDVACTMSNSAPALDVGGDLVLPGLVDGHMHLDKTLTGLPWMGHVAGPTRTSRIETDKKILPRLPLSTNERAGNLIANASRAAPPTCAPMSTSTSKAALPSWTGCLLPASAIATGSRCRSWPFPRVV